VELTKLKQSLKLPLILSLTVHTNHLKMAEQSNHPAPEDAWKHTGVRVIPADSLDANTAQTPGTPCPLSRLSYSPPPLPLSSLLPSFPNS